MNLRLNKNFYSVDAIKEALNDFKDICKGVIAREEQSFVEIRLEPCVQSVYLEREFCNYLLGLMNNKYLR
jgi:hypothetical protein